MKHRTNAGSWLAEHRKARLWLYGIAVAAMPVLVFYGLVSEEAAPLWLALVLAVLSVAPSGVAIANVPPPGDPDQ